MRDISTKWKPLASANDDDFFKAMDENPSAVYVVESYHGVDRQCLGIFSTRDKADAWMESQEEICVCCPYMINDPDFGNRKTS